MQTFKKHERLCSRVVIDQLFLTGRSFKVHPFIVNWNEFPSKNPSPLQVLMAVSSRNISIAPQRNHIRRLMREAYRKNKSLFTEFLKMKNRQCSFIIVYNGRGSLTSTEAESKIVLILQRLQREYEKTDR